MSDMSNDRIRQFLMTGTMTAKLATVRNDGRPHVAPIWFVLDGDDILFNTGESSVKGKNMRRDGRVSLSVDDQSPPYTFVIIEGFAELISDLDECRKWATTIGGRYMGQDRAEEFGRRNGVPGEYLVRVTPTKVIASDDTTG